MAKNKPTLFQQLQDEGAKTALERQDWRSSRALRVTIVLLSPLLCVLFFPSVTRLIFKSSESYVINKDQVWQNETIVAQSSFPVRKSEEQYTADVQDATSKTVAVFKPRSTIYSKPVADEIISALNKNGSGISVTTLRSQVRPLVQEIQHRDFISRSRASLTTADVAVMQSATLLVRKSRDSVVDSAEVINIVEQKLKDYCSQEQIRQTTDEILKRCQPSLDYWVEKTEALKSAAKESVTHNSSLVRKGEVVVSRGELITEPVLAKLVSYGYIRDESTSNIRTASVIAGSILHAILVYSLLILFLFFLRKKIFSDNLKLSSLSLLILFSAALSWLSLRLPSSYSSEYLVLVPAFAMIAAIYFDSRTGFILTVTSALMFAAVRSNDLNGAFALLFAGTLGAYSVRDLRTRTQLFRSIAFISIGFLLAILSSALERGSDLGSQVNAVVFSVVNAVLSPLVTFAVIALSERFFGVMTDLTLQEYDNVNHPLLLEMSEKAPGTYQHSLAIANLVESAAYAIEASPLLARVGAYFHDIGKIPKAEYFIENQIELENKHDLLSPRKSAAIIRNHVQDGVELAREYSLPERIVDFIPMHHGTALIKHFYAKAVDESDPETGEEIAQDQFRYPGPKPNSKETALVMLADGVEAISRTIDERDELEASIDKIFKEKVMDGQLDECDLTMNNLNTIKEIFARNLVGAHHQRLPYKELPTDTDDH